MTAINEVETIGFAPNVGSVNPGDVNCWAKICSLELGGHARHTSSSGGKLVPSVDGYRNCEIDGGRLVKCGITIF
ncbi:unnamed protein product [Schistosoma mattheei]|uniref:Uncharacterized protein n=1 Tax=Schistosoma mattheei TaxID=31246 RepID=A0A3P8G6J4_9TREM|nr:unnamed protein product [Schistosoma mattheei]